jgi:hypothetical protein
MGEQQDRSKTPPPLSTPPIPTGGPPLRGGLFKQGCHKGTSFGGMGHQCVNFEKILSIFAKIVYAYLLF